MCAKHATCTPCPVQWCALYSAVWLFSPLSGAGAEGLRFCLRHPAAAWEGRGVRNRIAHLASRLLQ